MSNKLFTTVPVPRFPRSVFNLSRPVIFTPRMHKEYPTEIIEIIPGDGMKIHTEAYAKSQPMVAPTFAKMDIAQESFFVPCWQLSNRFDDFITGGERGTNTDKMPFLYVSQIIQLLDSHLENFFEVDFGHASILNDAIQEYNEKLTQFQDIIESLDIFRSIPVCVPEFQLIPLDITGGSQAAEAIADANYDAWDELNGSLYDVSLRVNLLPFAAVLKIWCEFYRDENLCEDLFSIYWKGEEDSLAPNFMDLTGNVYTYLNAFYNTNSLKFELFYALFGLKSRAWKKDYFTSALPFVQKGPDVVLPMQADVIFEGPGTSGSKVNMQWSRAGSTLGPGLVTPSGSNTVIKGVIDGAQIGTTIQDVRTAIKLEEMYEADGRFGNRYPENTLGQFGVHTPDSRLPRCQFLGSNKQPVQIAQVIQNSSTDATSPQGNLAGLSSSYGSNFLTKTYQSQHGFLVCLTAIRVHALYQQGIHPMFSRYDRTEYAWPRFAHLGEQPIYTKELFVDDGVHEEDVFGYTPRYADYKSDKGSIHGLLKSSLNYWTMARRFRNIPQLNEEFIYGQPRTDAFVVTNHLQPCFVCELDYHVKANRVLPFYGQPHI